VAASRAALPGAVTRADHLPHPRYPGCIPLPVRSGRRCARAGPPMEWPTSARLHHLDQARRGRSPAGRSARRRPFSETCSRCCWRVGACTRDDAQARRKARP
jgi:hypothetical protein